MKPYYEHAGITIYHGDCREVLPTLAFDVMLSDPPYGISHSGWLVWNKERPHELDQATCELAWTNCVKGARVFNHLWNGMMRTSENDGPLVHPTQKPVALMKWCLSLRWVPIGMVCDPYMGAGATLIAAKDLGRTAIGIEIEERYCEIAAKRLSQEVLDFAR